MFVKHKSHYCKHWVSPMPRIIPIIVMTNANIAHMGSHYCPDEVRWSQQLVPLPLPQSPKHISLGPPIYRIIAHINSSQTIPSAVQDKYPYAYRPRSAKDCRKQNTTDDGRGSLHFFWFLKIRTAVWIPHLFVMSTFFNLENVPQFVVFFISKTIRPSLFCGASLVSYAYLFLIHMLFGFHIAGHHASTHWTAICIPNIYLLGYSSATRPSNPSSTKVSLGGLSWAPYTSFGFWKLWRLYEYLIFFWNFYLFQFWKMSHSLLLCSFLKQ